MAVYNQVLTYTFRDSLSLGDPNKIIKGAYLDGEFSAVHAASLDAASLSLTNTFSGNNTFSGTVTFSNPLSISNGLTVTGTVSMLGYPTTVSKASTTSRASNATPSIDPDLQIATTNTSGVYRLIAPIIVAGNAGSSTNPGLNIGFNFSGTSTWASQTVTSYNNTSLSGTSSSSFSGTSAPINGGLGPACVVRLEGLVKITSAGTFSIYWSQETSSSTATVLNAGSSLILTQVA